ncbi:MAG: Hsp20/alpha crystallin family protein [bacterium]|nr:heat-shock protein Hsp20 [Deltaproteobacteria bacterium]MCP4908045.1 Hsp20/alpha crystallin family protein [bacterium]
MTTFQRPLTWSPWPSLANELRRGRGGVPRAGGGTYQGTRGVFPPVNLDESDEGYVLTAELPGIPPEDIDISIEGTTVTLSGERKVENTAGDGIAFHRRERQSGSFRRAFELPLECDLDQAKATHKNGVLRLDLPKSKAVQPRQIEIETR